MKKVAIPVKDISLQFIGNAGHTPKFAIFDMIGAGPFKSFKLISVIDNPRSDIEFDDGDHEHSCSHDHHDEEHVSEHDKMGAVLKDCDYLVVKKACKNTVNAMKPYDITILKYNGNASKGDTILQEMASLII